MYNTINLTNFDAPLDGALMKFFFVEKSEEMTEAMKLALEVSIKFFSTFIFNSLITTYIRLRKRNFRIQKLSK